MAASLSLSSLFPLHSDQKSSSASVTESPGQNTSSNAMESHATTSTSNLLETIMEDENSGNSKRDNKENEGADCQHQPNGKWQLSRAFLFNELCATCADDSQQMKWCHVIKPDTRHNL